MKKVLTVSLVAAIAVAGNAFAVERDTRMSDIVRLLEDNPHLMAETEAGIAARAALKVPTTKVVSLKKTATSTQSTNGLYNSKISNPSLGGSKGGTIGGGNSMVQSGYTLGQIEGLINNADTYSDKSIWCNGDSIEAMMDTIQKAVDASLITVNEANDMGMDISHIRSTYACRDGIYSMIFSKKR